MRHYTICTCLLAALLFSCSGNKTAQIWTDRPEIAFYGEFFNSAQNQYKVSVRYFEYPSTELGKSASNPDIIVASWLKNTSNSSRFKSLESLFGAKKLSRSVFYPRLLAAGRMDRHQYLLPVAFNIPALIFSRGMEKDLSNPFTIDFDEIKKLSKGYNAETRGAYTRMGFSPLWNDDFLFAASVIFGASFAEDSPLEWDSEALDGAMDFIYRWTHEINTNNQAEEDFTFKYFFEPQERLIQSGRILFSYIESSSLFTLSDDSMNSLDFRWIMEQDSIPVTENIVYLGMPKRGKSPQAARAFVQWFFRIDTQRHLLEQSRSNRISETVFGISGGFSALSPVTEQVFPVFYPELLGRMPPSEFFMPHNNLPANWSVIKERVILPYLRDRALKQRGEEVYPLERRLSDWIRMNR